MVAWVEAEVSDWIDRRIELGKAEYVADEAARERMADVRLGKQHNAALTGSDASAACGRSG